MAQNDNNTHKKRLPTAHHHKNACMNMQSAYKAVDCKNQSQVGEREERKERERRTGKRRETRQNWRRRTKPAKLQEARSKDDERQVWAERRRKLERNEAMKGRLTGRTSGSGLTGRTACTALQDTQAVSSGSDPSRGDSTGNARRSWSRKTKKKTMQRARETGVSLPRRRTGAGRRAFKARGKRRAQTSHERDGGTQEARWERSFRPRQTGPPRCDRVRSACMCKYPAHCSRENQTQQARGEGGDPFHAILSSAAEVARGLELQFREAR